MLDRLERKNSRKLESLERFINDKFNFDTVYLSMDVVNAEKILQALLF